MKPLYIILFFLSIQLNAQQILPERQRAEVIDNILKDRFNNILPKLMDDTGIDISVL